MNSKETKQREIRFRFWYFESMRTDFDGWGAHVGINEMFKYCNENGGAVMQSTGLKDKNGKEIYEDDILECEGYRVRIIFSGGQFVGYNENLPIPETQNRNWLQWEVKGNIWENPELTLNPKGNESIKT